ncbi:MAG TPA: hypothetical protein VHD69_00670 [Candidatus Paceibacterota bacterium]|nr:hypothetical protein [Candidatus Paceibacterota bacterium]
MSVEFEENNFNTGRDFYKEPVPKLAGWLISHKLAKDLNGANRLQIMASLCFFALAIYFALF